MLVFPSDNSAMRLVDSMIIDIYYGYTTGRMYINKDEINKGENYLQFTKNDIPNIQYR